MASLRRSFSGVGQNAMGLSRQEREATETFRLPVWRRSDAFLPKAFGALGVFRGRRYSIRAVPSVNMPLCLGVNLSISALFAQQTAFRSNRLRLLSHPRSRVPCFI